MTQLALVLLFFLLAFAGLAVGLIFRRRGLRGSCGSAQQQTQNCRCETDLDASMQAQSNCCKPDTPACKAPRPPE